MSDDKIIDFGSFQNKVKDSDIDKLEEYMYSTAFEALIGFLYLTKQNDRLKLILEKCIEYVNNQEI